MFLTSKQIVTGCNFSGNQHLLAKISEVFTAWSHSNNPNNCIFRKKKKPCWAPSAAPELPWHLLCRSRLWAVPGGGGILWRRQHSGWVLLEVKGRKETLQFMTQMGVILCFMTGGIQLSFRLWMVSFCFILH